MLELDGASLTYEEFRCNCLEPNRPAIIRNACQNGGTTYFDLTELIHRLSPQVLLDTIGPETLVPVYPSPCTAELNDTAAKDGCAEAIRDEGETSPCGPTYRSGRGEAAAATEIDGDDDEGCREVPLRNVLESWDQTGAHRGVGTSKSRVYYLKDWHLQEALENAAANTEGELFGGSLAVTSGFARQREKGAHGNALYRVPDFLGADWMDPFCRYMTQSSASPLAGSEEEFSLPAAAAAAMQCGGNGLTSACTSTPRPVGFGSNRSDYRFAYIGPVGSWTPLHCDVFGTYSWSFNVCGDKLWFFPTMSGNAYLHAHLLPSFPTPPDIRVLTGFATESVVQHPGDLVFVPARFYHQVHNISGETFPASWYTNPAASDEETGSPQGASSTSSLVGPLTMALNHNWCNTFNIECMTQTFLRDAQRLVRSLSVDDLTVICDTKDVVVWRDYVDAMLHGGTNWSYASMTCFLTFCVHCIGSVAPGMVAAEDERAMAGERVRQLLAEVRESYEHLFAA
ncbi:hypothetical protein ABB37_04335 [Leptomonas pyrrhocoris]|uniref:JmjC domain-containing protein n=1 Tax=Leptomonas pyrrhocoris TaxID=157538 RepID=A0A0M9G2P6_LEPPY|nr:hypothetical protein ABB37_04335 [Leptomonas pyrrhocoris]KPA80939.1 hypothetical protein ABB37_04335 [Leptomonas pyrrhocoris]|eukprot:XP_015659378.1 hypothetical protein ABB37_04335 [Leptomonas pyrrhocoris]